MLYIDADSNVASGFEGFLVKAFVDAGNELGHRGNSHLMDKRPNASGCPPGRDIKVGFVCVLCVVWYSLIYQRRLSTVTDWCQPIKNRADTLRWRSFEN